MENETLTEPPSPDCYREAAWAVVSVGIGLPANPARPSPASSRLRKSQSPSRPQDPAPFPQPWRKLTEEAQAQFQARSVAILVGGLAEARVTGGNEARACLYDGMAIYAVLIQSGEMAPTIASAMMVRLSQQAKAVLANPATWAAVCRVASALACAGQLAAHEVRDLVRGEVLHHAETVDAGGSGHVGERASIG